MTRGQIGKFSKDDESGFTLIEVLTVAILVGILAAIAITTFATQTGKGGDAAAMSDERNLAVSEEAYMASGTSYGTATQLAAAAKIAASMGDTVWVYTQGSQGFCLVAHHVDSQNYLIYNSMSGGLQSTKYTSQSAAQGVCTAAGFTSAGTISNSNGTTSVN